MLGHLLGNLRRDAATSGMNEPNGVNQFRAKKVFQQVAYRASLKSTQGLNVTGCGGEDNKASMGKIRAECLDGVNAPKFRHTYVHEGNVRLMKAKHPDGFLTVRSFGHSSHVCLRVDFTDDSGSHQGMVIDDKNSNRLFLRHQIHP